MAVPRGGYINDNLELPLQSQGWWVCRAGGTFCLLLGTGRRLGGPWREAQVGVALVHRWKRGLQTLR